MVPDSDQLMASSVTNSFYASDCFFGRVIFCLGIWGVEYD